MKITMEELINHIQKLSFMVDRLNEKLKTLEGKGENEELDEQLSAYQEKSEEEYSDDLKKIRFYLSGVLEKPNGLKDVFSIISEIIGSHRKENY